MNTQAESPISAGRPIPLEYTRSPKVFLSIRRRGWDVARQEKSSFGYRANDFSVLVADALARLADRLRQGVIGDGDAAQVA
jgi:hypothetical protein